MEHAGIGATTVVIAASSILRPVQNLYAFFWGGCQYICGTVYGCVCALE